MSKEGRGPTSFTWQGVLPPAVRLDSARLEFAHTRTVLREVILRVGEESTPFVLAGFVATVDLDEPLFDRAAPIDLSLEVRFEGEAPRPTGVVINGDKPIDLPSWYPAGIVPGGEVPPEVAARLWAVELERIAVPMSRTVLASTAPPTTDDDAVFEERDLAIQRDELIRRAFLGHDAETNPNLNAPAWAAGLSDLNDQLGDRVKVYATVGGGGKYPDYPKQTGDALTRLKGVSGDFRAIFEALIAAEPGTDPTVDLFDWAFEHFVTGTVVTRHNDLEWQEVLLNHGCPNSSYYLRYPMLAVACLESKVDDDFWKDRLATLVRTAQIFLESAAPLVAAPYPSPEVDFVFQPDRHFPRSRRKALRKEYEDMLAPISSWDATFDLLRGRLASLIGQALTSDGTTSSATKKPISGPAVATLLPLGVET